MSRIGHRKVNTIMSEIKSGEVVANNELEITPMGKIMNELGLNDLPAKRIDLDIDAMLLSDDPIRNLAEQCGLFQSTADPKLIASLKKARESALASLDQPYNYHL